MILIRRLSSHASLKFSNAKIREMLSKNSMVYPGKYSVHVASFAANPINEDAAFLHPINDSILLGVVDGIKSE